MFLTRQNAKGGKEITKFCQIENENGRLGYKIGYCDHCNHKILLSFSDAEYIASMFPSYEETSNIFKELKEKTRLKLIHFLGG